MRMASIMQVSFASILLLKQRISVREPTNHDPSSDGHTLRGAQ